MRNSRTLAKYHRLLDHIRPYLDPAGSENRFCIPLAMIWKYPENPLMHFRSQGIDLKLCNLINKVLCLSHEHAWCKLTHDIFPTQYSKFYALSFFSEIGGIRTLRVWNSGYEITNSGLCYLVTSPIFLVIRNIAQFCSLRMRSSDGVEFLLTRTGVWSSD